MVAESLHQVQRNTPIFRGCRKRFLDPFVGFSAHVNNEVGLGDGRDVLGRRLVAVQIGAVLDEQFQVHVVYALAQNVLDPVVLRVDGRDDGNLFLG